jgi:hypothetical protein
MDYACKDCGAKEVKLWRDYSSFHVHLRCLACACKDQGKTGFDEKFKSGDQIGWLVPAVPDGEGNFWGYTSVPQDLVDWWHSLLNQESK